MSILLFGSKQWLTLNSSVTFSCQYHQTFVVVSQPSCRIYQSLSFLSAIRNFKGKSNTTHLKKHFDIICILHGHNINNCVDFQSDELKVSNFSTHATYQSSLHRAYVPQLKSTMSNIDHMRVEHGIVLSICCRMWFHKSIWSAQVFKLWTLQNTMEICIFLC